MLNKPNLILLLSILAAPTFVAEAAESIVREARSNNGRFLLRIDPGQPGRNGSPCEATLYEQRAAEERGREVWQRPLVNESGPTHVYVSNTAAYVVTLNEYRRGGSRHAVVIYGERGELLRHFLLPDLLTRHDWKHVRIGRRHIDWLDGATCSFTEDGDAFVIDLKWNRTLRINLKRLMVERTGEQADHALADVPPDVLLALFGELGEADDVQTPTTGPAAELAPADDVDSASDQETIDDDLAALLQPSAYEPQVPVPDPADPVDYVAWLNALGEVAGPDANPLYQEAMDSLQTWEGIDEQLKPASQGDPDALAAPELAAWLLANESALEQFRAATQLPEKGWQRSSASGRLIDVLLPDLAGLRKLARGTLAVGRQHASTGQVDQAASAYLDTLAAGAHIGSGLTLIENLVGISVQMNAADALYDLHANPAADDLDYTQLSAELQQAYQPPRPPTEALQAERAFFMDAAQHLWSIDPETGKPRVNAERVDKLLSLITEQEPGKVEQVISELEAAGFEQTVAQGNAYYDVLTEMLSLPYAEAAPRLEQFEEMMMSEPGTNPLLRTLTPSVTRYIFLHARGEATRRAALLATRLEAHRQQFGNYPEDLSLIDAGEFAIDPFSATTFRYQRTDDGYQLYSRGADGDDDGGNHEPSGADGDLRFWPRPD